MIRHILTTEGVMILTLEVSNKRLYRQRALKKMFFFHMFYHHIGDLFIWITIFNIEKIITYRKTCKF